MKGILATPNGEVQTQEYGEPLYKSTGKAVDGHIEIVRPRRLGRPYVMIVNEDFLRPCLPLNPVGSYLYRTDEHGHPICGNIIILKEAGEDLVGLDDDELRIIKGYMQMIYAAVT